ncbi:amidohydrolase family protein [Dactylosporangium sp. CA-092794]|uniref:amidohydrolase family protein n=1 Tax=Dactylosporangium sp. CA-092794 TaxID=3239929 RepID=UPI003D9121DD
MSELLLRDVEVAGRAGLDVRIAGGRIAAIGPGLPRAGAGEVAGRAGAGEVAGRAGASEVAGRGGALLPGLRDHHIHLLAAAARAGSLDVSPAHAPDLGALAGRLRAAAATGRPVRAVGYDDEATGRIDAAFLDRAGGGVPIRVQHRGGHAWVLGSAGRPAGVRTGPDGWVYGAEALPPAAGPPALGELSRRLAGYGVTAVTDASPGNDAAVAAHVAAARARGELLQAVTLMGRGVPGGADKIMLEEHAGWSLDETAARIAAAHRAGRPVALHCASGAAVVFALAAFDEAGPRAGDRVEHASVLDAGLLPRLAASGLTVVTQPGFLHDRGDDYLSRVDPADVPGLYRIGSLLAAGVPVGGSSDAPFGPDDPWLAMRTAVTRATRTGRVVGAAERITPEQALALYTGPADRPGGRPREVRVGAPADLCLLRVPWREARASLAADLVAATVIAGRVAHAAP